MVSPYINHFLQPDTIIPDPSNPQSWNRYSYVGNNPVVYNDPSGHFKCINKSTAFSGDCQKIVNQWLTILETKGGDEGEALTKAFRNADERTYCGRHVGSPCASVKDQITITIIDTPKNSNLRAQYATNGANTFTLTAGMMAMPDENNEDDLATAGQLGHEIDHMMHPASSGTLRGEVHAYDIQYKIYKNMGIEGRYHENGDVWVAAYGSSLKGASNKELRNSEIARQNPGLPVNTFERVLRDIISELK